MVASPFNRSDPPRPEHMRPEWESADADKFARALALNTLVTQKTQKLTGEIADLLKDAMTKAGLNDEQEGFIGMTFTMGLVNICSKEAQEDPYWLLKAAMGMQEATERALGRKSEPAYRGVGEHIRGEQPPNYQTVQDPLADGFYRDQRRDRAIDNDTVHGSGTMTESYDQREELHRLKKTKT
jgi:hypothetical protein